MLEMIGDLAASGCSGCISAVKGRDISHLALIFFDFLPAIRAAVSRELQCTEGSRARSVAGRKERPSFRHAGPA
jgi:hypothetical protein